MIKPVWSNLEHEIWRASAEWPTFNKALVALSGGLDSLVLLSIMRHLASARGIQLIAANVHHGPGPHAAWRSEVQKVCQKLCEDWGLEFFPLGPSLEPLKTEAEFRQYRYQELRKLKKKENCDYILTAHHGDDLLETRVLRLLRGTGPLGLEAIRPWDGDLGRPLIFVDKQKLIKYAQEKNLPIQEDPSNQHTDMTRNWVRKDLLPFIAARQPEMISNLQRSLELLVEELSSSTDNRQLEEVDGGVVFSRQDFLALSLSRKHQRIARVFQRLKIPDYSQGQIKEICRRLDNSPTVNIFRIGLVSWKVDAKQVFARGET